MEKIIRDVRANSVSLVGKYEKTFKGAPQCIGICV